MEAIALRPLAIYTIATAAFVAITSGLLALVRLREAMAPIRTWLVMLPIILGALWLGQGIWVGLVAAVSLAAFAEFARATGLARDRLLVGAVALTIVAANAAILLGQYTLFAAIPALGMLLVIAVPIVRNRAEGMLPGLGLGVFAVVAFAYALGHLSLLGASPLGPGYVLFVVLATQANDAFGFIWGKLAGRHRWTPISPNKTVEGSLLAAATTVALAFVHWPIAFPHLPAAGVALAGLVVAFGGQLGDLAFATIKRGVGVKDYGSILPGHGGILDRANSLVVTAPAFTILAALLWGGIPGGPV